MIRVIYLAKLADLLSTDEETVPPAADTDALLQTLRARGGVWQEVLDKHLYKTAVNNRIVHGNTPLKDGDTVALLPPVTGG